MSSPPAGDWTPLTRAYVGVLAARVALYVTRGLWPANQPFETVQSLVHGAGFLASIALGLVWLHRAWARIPEPCRRTYDDRRVEPDEAIWKLFIPFYGVFYWVFIASIGLCGAVERHLKRVRAQSASVPSTLAFVTCLVQLVPGVNLFVSPFLWGLFMARVDGAQAEADRRESEAIAPRPIGALRVIGIVGGAMIVGWGTLILLFLALWQFLSPSGPPVAPPH
jgi:hypothetical protein